MIKIKDLSININKTMILDHIDLNIDKGITVIIGPNGSGKTTLLRAIENLIEPGSGEILINGVKYEEKQRMELAKVITYLPQNRPIPNLEGGLLIEHGRFPYLGFSKKLKEEDKLIINQAIKDTHTEDLLDKNLLNMSGGERQKIYIACALAQNTPIIMLDEPTTHLDLPYQIEILNLIKELKNKGKNIILVLHDLIEAFEIADDIIILDNARLVYKGKKEDCIDKKYIKDVFNATIIKENDEKALFKYKLLK